MPDTISVISQARVSIRKLSDRSSAGIQATVSAGGVAEVARGVCHAAYTEVTAGTAASGTKARVPISRTSSGARRAATACATSRASNGPPRKDWAVQPRPGSTGALDPRSAGRKGVGVGLTLPAGQREQAFVAAAPCAVDSSLRGGDSEGPGPLPLRVRSGSFVVCGSGLLDHDGDVRGHLVVEADVG